MYDRMMLTYELTLQSMFHCGTGMAQGFLDRTVVRDHDNFLYIPGSTVKGILREQCECLAQALEVASTVRDPHEPFPGPLSPREMIAVFRDGPDLVEQIFGCHRQESSLFFDHAWMVKKDQDFFTVKEERKERLFKRMQTAVRTQTRLSRLTRTAQEQALYTSEFGIPELQFTGKIHGCLQGPPLISDSAQELPGTYSLLLLIAGMRLLNRLGANRSTGMGQVGLKITKLSVNETVIEKPEESYCKSLDSFILYEDARRET